MEQRKNLQPKLEMKRSGQLATGLAMARPCRGFGLPGVVSWLSASSRSKSQGAMPLIEFLRKTNGQGKIHKKLERRHKEEVAADPSTTHDLAAWANSAPCQGGRHSRDVSVALQRRVLRAVGPTECPLPLHGPEGLEKVPAHLYHQAMVYLLRPGHWTSAANIRAELELEAFREHHIRNITAMLFANQGLIQRYLDGKLNKDKDEPAAEPRAGAQTVGTAGEDRGRDPGVCRQGAVAAAGEGGRLERGGQGRSRGRPVRKAKPDHGSAVRARGCSANPQVWRNLYWVKETG